MSTAAFLTAIITMGVFMTTAILSLYRFGFGQLSQRIVSLETTVNRRIDGLDGRMDLLDGKVSRLEETVQGLREDVAVLKATQ